MARHKKHGKDFLPDWGKWLIGLVLAGIFLLVVYATHIVPKLIDAANIHLTLPKWPSFKAKPVSVSSQLTEFEQNQHDFLDAANEMKIISFLISTTSQDLAQSLGHFGYLHKKETEILLKFHETSEKMSLNLKRLRPVPKELAECDNLLVEMLLSMGKMENCFEPNVDTNPNHPSSILFVLPNEKRYVFMMAYKSLIENGNRLSLKLPAN